MKEYYTGVDLPNLIGCTVRLNNGVVVVGVIADVEVQNDWYRIKFQSVDQEQTDWYGKDRLGTSYYNALGATVVEVIALHTHDDYTELERFFANILAENRVIGAIDVVVLQDLLQARAVVKAMKELVSDES